MKTIGTLDKASASVNNQICRCSRHSLNYLLMINVYVFMLYFNNANVIKYDLLFSHICWVGVVVG